jgi:hypothetical protein
MRNMVCRSRSKDRHTGVVEAGGNCMRCVDLLGLGRDSGDRDSVRSGKRSAATWEMGVRGSVCRWLLSPMGFVDLRSCLDAIGALV